MQTPPTKLKSEKKNTEKRHLFPVNGAMVMHASHSTARRAWQTVPRQPTLPIILGVRLHLYCFNVDRDAITVGRTRFNRDKARGPSSVSCMCCAPLLQSLSIILWILIFYQLSYNLKNNEHKITKISKEKKTTWENKLNRKPKQIRKNKISEWSHDHIRLHRSTRRWCHMSLSHCRSC